MDNLVFPWPVPILPVPISPVFPTTSRLEPSRKVRQISERPGQGWLSREYIWQKVGVLYCMDLSCKEVCFWQWSIIAYSSWVHSTVAIFQQTSCNHPCTTFHCTGQQIFNHCYKSWSQHKCFLDKTWLACIVCHEKLNNKNMNKRVRLSVAVTCAENEKCSSRERGIKRFLDK